MRLFMDTEFTELSQRAQLISLALVSEDDRWFYAEFTDYDPTGLSDWHRTNVIPHLQLTGSNTSDPQRLRNWQVKGHTATVQVDLRTWLDQFAQPEGNPVDVWADCLAYDWVLFCELFGGALHLPKPLFYLPFDLVTLLKINGIDPDIRRELFAFDDNPPESPLKHHALWDARVVKRCYENLTRET